MDINLIRSLSTLCLFVFFIVLVWQLYRKKNKRHYEDASKLLFNDGDERSEKINPINTKVENHD